MENINLINDQQFYEDFIMDKQTFLEMITYIKKPFSEKNLVLKALIYIYFISHGSSVRSIRSMFGIPTTTSWRFCDEMSQISSTLAHRDIK